LKRKYHCVVLRYVTDAAGACTSGREAEEEVYIQVVQQKLSLAQVQMCSASKVRTIFIQGAFYSS